jgi:hypothetical protein
MSLNGPARKKDMNLIKHLWRLKIADRACEDLQRRMGETLQI